MDNHNFSFIELVDFSDCAFPSVICTMCRGFGEAVVLDDVNQSTVPHSPIDSSVSQLVGCRLIYCPVLGDRPEVEASTNTRWASDDIFIFGETKTLSCSVHNLQHVH